MNSKKSIGEAGRGSMTGLRSSRFFFVAAALLVATLVYSLVENVVAAGNLTLGNYTLVASRRLSSTVYEYDYRAQVTNSGPAVTNVMVDLNASTLPTGITAVEGHLIFGAVGANATVTSSDTFTVRHDRRYPFNVSALVWTIHFDPLIVVNHAPVADAGTDQAAAVNATVALDGSHSSDPDGDALTYAWSFVSHPTGSTATLLNPATVNPTFRVDKAGRYTVQLLVNDGQVNSVADTVVISTLNTAPVAQAGQNQTARLGTTITLDGSHSSDVDGDALTYAWSFVSRPTGSTATLLNPTTVNPTFSVDKAGSYIVQLVVNDGQVNSAPATVTISTENSPPVANAGAAQTTQIGKTVTLDGSASSDVDGDALTFRWALITVPTGSLATLSNAQAVKPTFIVDQPGAYVAQLIVNDGQVDSAPATVTLSTENVPPVAKAGPDQTAPVGSTVTLDGRQSIDPDHDAITYAWSLTAKPSGSQAQLNGSTTAQPTFVIDKPGTYIAQLIVNDGHVDSAPATVTISTVNSKPVANAGPDQIALTGATVTLNGAASHDADNDPLTYQWSLTARPTGSATNLTNPTQAQATLVPDVAGNYLAQLIVNDGQIDSDPDSALVTVTAATPTTHPPVITSTPLTTATANQHYQYALTATDPDVGDTLSYALTTKPNGMTINAATGLIEWTPTTVGGANAVARATDAHGLFAEQNFTIIVAAGTANQAPTVDAGNPQTITLPTASVALNGTVTDDGLPNPPGALTFTWSKVSGPGIVTFINANSASTVVSFSAEGIYILRLTAADGALSASDMVQITVNPADSNTRQERLLPLGSNPGGVTLGDTKEVIFTVNLVGSPGVTPSEVTLQALDETGINVINDLGPLHDDGLNGDLIANNFVYSGTFSVQGNQVGKLFYRAKALIPGIGEIISEPYIFEVTPFRVGSQPSNLEKPIKLPNNTVEVVADEVLVFFAKEATNNDIATIAASINGTVLGYLPQLGVYQIRLKNGGTPQVLDAAISQLSKNTLVVQATPNSILYATGFPNDQYLKDQWAIPRIRADETALIARGQEGIAILDSGIDAYHPELMGKVKPVWDFISGDDSPDHEGNDHGTHVAGIAGAKSNNTIGITGIAWYSQLLDIRVINYRGRMTELSGAEGIQKAANLGVKIINCSWGGNIFNWDPNAEDMLDIISRYAIKKGSLIVAAAGNDNIDIDIIPFFPASFPGVMAIGATNDSDNRHETSNSGNSISLAAPGQDILSTIIQSRLAKKSGTSMAAPHVSGAAAVLWSLHPKWTATEIRERLENTAKPLKGEQLGAGRLDLFEAVFNGSFEIGNEGWVDPENKIQIVENWNGISASDRKKFAVFPPFGFGTSNLQLIIASREINIPPGISQLPIRFDWQLKTPESYCAVKIHMRGPAGIITTPKNDDDLFVFQTSGNDYLKTTWNKFEYMFPIDGRGGVYHLGFVMQPDTYNCLLFLDKLELRNGNNTNNGGGIYNTAPIANAGFDQNKIRIGQIVKLDGSGSYDPDRDPLIYAWTFVKRPDGSSAALDNAQTDKPQFTMDVMGRYVLSLIVGDGITLSEPDTVIIASETPIAKAGPDQTVLVNTKVELDGSQSKDIDGKPLTYRWSFVAIPTNSTAVLEDANTAKPHFTADKEDIYTVQLIVNNGESDSVPDTVGIRSSSATP
jgi:hypothetical protein